MAKPIKLVDEITDPDDIKAFLEYMERPATEEEKLKMNRAREVYRNTEVIGRNKNK